MALKKSFTFTASDTTSADAYHQADRAKVKKFLEQVSFCVFKDEATRNIAGKGSEYVTYGTKKDNVSVVTTAHEDAVLDEIYKIAKLLDQYDGAVDV